MGLHIRDCRETDAGALRALAGSLGLSPADFGTSALRLILADRRQTLLVALEQEQIIGAVHLIAEGPVGRVCRFLMAEPRSASRKACELLAEAGLWLSSRGAGQTEISLPLAAFVGTEPLTAAGFAKTLTGAWTKPLIRAREAS